MFKLIVNVESLTKPSGGIARYTQAIVNYAVQFPDLEIICFQGLSSFVLDRQKPLSQQLAVQKSARTDTIKSRLRTVPFLFTTYSTLRRMYFARQYAECGDAVYLEPNLILNPFAGQGIAVVHDVSHLRFPQFHPRPRLAFLNRYFAKTLGAAAAVIADSHFTAAEIAGYYPQYSDKVQVIHLGVDAVFHPRTALQCQAVLQQHALVYRQFVLCVATLEPRKNLTRLVTAYLRLPAELRLQFPLVLVGEVGWGIDEMLRDINQLQEQGVRYLGIVPDVALPELYAAAALVAFVPLYEGFGLPALEAMASGTPLLASTAASLPEVVGDAALCVDPLDEQAICAGMLQLLQNQQLAQQYIAKGLQQSAKFSWERCAQQTLDLVCDVAAQPRLTLSASSGSRPC